MNAVLVSRRTIGDNPFLSIKLQFVGELRAKKIYGRAIGGNNFFASNKEPYGTPSFKAATDMPTVNNQRALPSGLRDGPREVFPAKKLSPPIAAAKMQSPAKVFVLSTHHKLSSPAAGAEGIHKWSVSVLREEKIFGRPIPRKRLSSKRSAFKPFSMMN